MRHITTVDRNIVIARRLRESEVVRNDCRSTARALMLEGRAKKALSFRILPCRGLVEHQEPRLRGERRGDRQSALQLRCEVAWMLTLPASQPQHVERLSRLRLRGGARRAERARTEHSLLENRARKELPSRILEDETDESRPLVHGHVREVHRCYTDASRTSRYEPHDRSGKSALSCAIFPGPCNYFAVADRH